MTDAIAVTSRGARAVGATDQAGRVAQGILYAAGCMLGTLAKLPVDPSDADAVEVLHRTAQLAEEMHEAVADTPANGPDLRLLALAETLTGLSRSSVR